MAEREQSTRSGDDSAASQCPPTNDGPITDLAERLRSARRALLDGALEASSLPTRYRLIGKAEGVALALDYIDELAR
jgi:hypothetical protein